MALGHCMSGRWGIAALSLLCTALAGCAATPAAVMPPAERLFVAYGPVVDVPKRSVVDSRAEGAKRDRHSAGDTPTTYLGDRAFSPDPQTILAVELNKKLPEKYLDSAIELTRFDVGLVPPVAAGSTKLPKSVPPLPGMHPGAYVVGGLIGGLILSGLNKP